MGGFLKLPLGKRVVLPPFSSVSGLFPFKIFGSSMSGLFDILDMRGVFCKFTYCIKGRLVKYQLYNNAKIAVTLAAKTFVMGVKSDNGHFVVQCLSGRQIIMREGQVVSFNDRVSALSVGDHSWEKKFPVVFSEKVIAHTDAMKELAVRRSEFRMKGDIYGSMGHAYNIEKLISNKELIDNAVASMVENGYIEKVPMTEVCHLHPLLYLPKGQDGIRVVCDLTEVNSYFVHASGDLPGVGQVLRSIPSEWVYFCKIDIKNGFFRVPLSEEIRNMFGFLFGGQRWRFCVLPQGWLLSPGLFHERMCRITADLEIVSYVDDILVGAATLSALAEKVQNLLVRMARFGLQIQKKKFEYGAKCVRFLGFEVHSGGYICAKKFLKEREESVLKEITSKTELQRVLGIFNYVRSHVPHLAKKVAELSEILRRCPAHFSADLQQKVTFAVSQAWHLIFNSCVRVMKGQPRGRFMYHLFTDWSKQAKGYCLERVYEVGKTEIVDLGSAVFTEGATYSSFLGELSCLKWALERVKSLISGVSVVCFCDNAAAVKSLQNFQERGQDVRVTRLYVWIIENIPNASFAYIPGTNNVMADFLSREVSFVGYVKSGNGVINVGLPSADIRAPSWEEKQNLIKDAHLGHWGVQRTYENLVMALQGKWKGMHAEVESFVRHCRSCQLHGEPLVRDDLSGPQAFMKNELAHLDFTGPFKNGQSLLVGVDNYSRFTHAVPVSSPSATAVITFLRVWEELHGSVKGIFSDQGPAFMSSQLQEWLNAHAVSHTISPGYYHRANGICERMHRTLHGRVRRFLTDGLRWELAFEVAVREVNRSYNRTIGTCPRMLMESCDRHGNNIEGVEQLQHRVNQRVAAEKQKTDKWWRKRRKFSAALQVGDEVLLEIHDWQRRVLGKLSPRWDGPYVIKRRLSRSVWAISATEDSRPREWIMAHSTQLKKWFANP